MSGTGRGKALTRPAWMHRARQPPMQAQPFVASDWSKVLHVDGRPYWHNRSTGQTTWEDPSSNGNAATSVPTTTSSGTWTQHHTEDGRVYYYNAAANKTQWQPPSGDAIAPTSQSSQPSPKQHTKKSALQPSPTADALPEGWAEHTTKDGLTYYYHSATRETSWERPTNMKSNKRPRELSNSEAQSDVPLVEPGSADSEWEQLVTPEGKVYFHKKSTGETSWTKLGQAVAPPTKRPRTSLKDLREVVSSQHAKKEHSRTGAVRRPRSNDGKALTDRQAEKYFMKRAQMRKQSSTSEAMVVESKNDLSPTARQESFYQLLKDIGITEKTPWLHTMSKCARDPRYMVLSPYGNRKDAWLKYCHKQTKQTKRDEIINTRKAAESLLTLLEECFKDEPHNTANLNHCGRENVRRMESSPRYTAVNDRSRDMLIRSFFSARFENGLLEQEKRRKKAMDSVNVDLEKCIHPSLLPPFNVNKEQDAVENVKAAVQVDGISKTNGDIKSEYGHKSLPTFTDATSFRDLKSFILRLDAAKDLDDRDISRAIRQFQKRIDVIAQKKRAEERELLKAKQKESRAKFRSGVEQMILKGKIPPTSRWKDVSKIISQEDFAKSEPELDALPCDLFENAVSLFEDRVHEHREEFKKLLKSGNIEINDATTVEELQSNEIMKSFIRRVERSVVEALIVDRKRKERKKRQKERDIVENDYRTFLLRSIPSTDYSYEAVSDTWKEEPAVMKANACLDAARVREIYEEVVVSQRGRNERVHKRKFESPVGSMGPIPTSEREVSKRARMSGHHDGIPFGNDQSREEENGWSAAVSARPLTEAEKAQEREKRKREILGSLEDKRQVVEPGSKGTK